MSKVLESVVAIIIAVIVAGCASTGSPTFRLPAGSKVEVTQELTVASGARVTIQHGRVISRREVNTLEPHCQFFLDRSTEQMREPIVIRPGTFTVKSTAQLRDFTWAEGLQFAQLGDQTRFLTTLIELSSDQQPEVRDLRCTVWGSLRLDGHLTLDQMQATLGDLVKLVAAAD